jgi:hypothetical protein
MLTEIGTWRPAYTAACGRITVSTATALGHKQYIPPFPLSFLVPPLQDPRNSKRLEPQYSYLPHLLDR